ncbi:MAG: protein-glutamine gamma-glutamyltransferase [Clostridiales bacterium]|nr:protein-glutamine gamma-glutamyltransferase [Clostridiales bacterium]
MIYVNGAAVSPEAFQTEYPEGSVEQIVLGKLAESGARFSYPTMNHLKFELRLRKEIVAASYALNRSGLRFAVFRESRCNPAYWNRARDGGFVLKDGVKPSDAVADIFRHGSKYGTECATAMMIVYYGALLNTYGEAIFNKTFQKIELMNWHRIHKLLWEVGNIRRREVYLPGDRRYFDNPDVDPLTPEWQGENAIQLGNGMFYGHGVGIQKPETIIQALNQHRMENADESAVLLDAAGRSDFNKLANISLRGST